MPEHYVARNPQAAWRVYDGEAVILLAQDSTLNTLNPVGTFIWQAADGKAPFSTVVSRICQEFDVDPVEARRDAAAFIEKLSRRGLVSLSETPQDGS
jgi:hypothetical protein